MDTTTPSDPLPSSNIGTLSASSLITSAVSSISGIIASPAVTGTPALSPSDVDDDVPAHHSNPVVAFMIGLSIVVLSSILNAGGLNLTKLDHVSQSFGTCT